MTLPVCFRICAVMSTEVSEMVERVARAMYAVIPDPKAAWEESHWGQRAFFRAYAAAAMAAMREPTAAMVEAAESRQLSVHEPLPAGTAWRLMIAAALGESGDGA